MSPRWPTPCANPPGVRSGRSGSRTEHPGAATTASSAGAATARAPRTPTWKAPLRAALERLGGRHRRRHGAARRGACPDNPDPWAARDGYVDVVVGAEIAGRVRGAMARDMATTTTQQRSLESWRHSASGWRCSRATPGSGTIRMRPETKGGAPSRRLGGTTDGRAGRLGAGTPADRRPRVVQVTRSSRRRCRDLPARAQGGGSADTVRSVPGPRPARREPERMGMGE